MTEFVSEAFKVNTLSGSFELKIHNFSLQQKALGNKLTSPTFKLCNHLWSLDVYLGGMNESSKDAMPLYLHNQDDSEITPNFTFILVSQVMGHDSLKFSQNTRRFLPKGATRSATESDGWGTYSFKQTLITDPHSPYILNDTVIFKVEISLSNVVTVPKFVVKNAPNLSDCWLTFWMDTIGTDITLVVCFDEENSVKIPAHKPVLMARSPVFKAMFTHNMSESNTNEIVISDFSPEVVREMLHFMYTDKLQSETLENIVYEGLLGAAIKYDVPGLINLCEAHFCGQLCDDNVVETLILAESCGAADLKQFTFDHIKRNALQLVNRADFQPLLDSFSQHLSGQSVAKKRKITQSCGNDGKIDSSCIEDDSCLIM